MSLRFMDLDPDYVINWIEKDGVHEIQEKRRVKIMQDAVRVIATADLNISTAEDYPTYVVRAVKRLSAIEAISLLDEDLQWELPDRRVLEAAIDLRKLVDTVINPSKTVIATSHCERPETEIHILPDGKIQVIGEYASLENQAKFFDKLLFCDVVLRKWEDMSEPFDPQMLTVIDNDRVPPEGRNPPEDWENAWMTKILVKSAKKTMGYAMNIARIHRRDLTNLLLGMIPTVLSPSFVDSMKAITEFTLPVFKKGAVILMIIGGKKEDKAEIAANIAQVQEFKNRFMFLVTGAFLPPAILIEKDEKEKAMKYLLKIYKNDEENSKKVFEALQAIHASGSMIAPSHVKIMASEVEEAKLSVSILNPGTGPEFQEKLTEELTVEETTKIIDTWIDEEDIPTLSSAAMFGPTGIEESPTGIKETLAALKKKQVPTYVFGGDTTRALRLARIKLDQQYSTGGAAFSIMQYLLGIALIPQGLYYTVIGTLRAKEACGF